jgi:CspA family cold shock protein
MGAADEKSALLRSACTGRHEMAEGTVKWFSAARGYGFIERSGDGADVFAHFSNLADRSLLELVEGQRVRFDVARNPKGLLAENIVCE